MLGNYGPMPGMGNTGSGGGAVGGMTLEQALARVQLAQKSGDRKNEAIHRLIMGKIYLEKNQPTDAANQSAQALTLFRAVKNTIGEASCHLVTGQALYLNGKFPGARKAYQDALAIYKRFGDQAGQALSHTALAAIHVDDPARPDVAKARKHLEEAVALYQKVGDFQSRQSAAKLLQMIKQA